MVAHFAFWLLLLLMTACSRPTDIVFGAEPLKQVAAQADQFNKLPEQDRLLVIWYLAVAQVGGTSVVGRTVGDVLTVAKANGGYISKLDAEEWVRRAQVLSERKIVADKIAASVEVIVRSTEVLPRNRDARLLRDTLVVNFFVHNKSGKDIRQLKGRVTFFDATGDPVGSLSVDIDEGISSRWTLDTTTGTEWSLNSVMMGDVERIAARHFNNMTARFEGEAIAFIDGEVLKAPSLKADLARF